MKSWIQSQISWDLNQEKSWAEIFKCIIDEEGGHFVGRTEFDSQMLITKYL
jgi:ribosomal protein S12 methylthiotransferase